jgi:hypothetical protein
MNESGVSDPEAHKEAVMKRCKLKFVPIEVGDAAMIYIKTVGSRLWAPSSNLETDSYEITASKQRFSMFWTRCIACGSSLPTCQT